MMQTMRKFYVNLSASFLRVEARGLGGGPVGLQLPPPLPVTIAIHSYMSCLFKVGKE